MREMVSRIRQIDAMREIRYTPDPEQRRRMMRGAYAVRDISKGETIGADDVIALRPMAGRMPHEVIGTVAGQAYRSGDAL